MPVPVPAVPAAPARSAVALPAVDLLRKVVEHTPVVLWAIDADGIFTLSEGRGLAALGLEPGQVVGQSAFEMYRDHAGVTALLQDALAGEERHVVLDVPPNVFETWLQPLRDPCGVVIGAVGVSTDVTARMAALRDLERLNAELSDAVRTRNELLERTSQTLEEQIFEHRRIYRELERSEARWRSLVQSAPDVILQLDRDGRIEFINHPAETDVRTVDEILGRPSAEFLFPESQPELARVLNDVFEHERPATTVVSGPTGDGEPCWYQAHLAPLRHDGQVVAATVVVRDITQQHRAEEQLRQTQDELAHVARVSMVGEMTASFAHELNQPLAAIAHYIAGCVIRLERAGVTDPAVLATLQDAAAEARRASEVVRRLRLFLQKNEMLREMADLNQIVREALQLIESTLHKHHVDSACQLAADLPLIYVDRIQIMQVLMNLLLNAAEAMEAVTPEQRRIVIATRLTDTGHVECAIRDAGPGLPTGLPHDIFDAFVTTKSNGLGLGLSISRSIMVAHGGAVRAASTPTGAEFCLRFSSEVRKGLP